MTGFGGLASRLFAPGPPPPLGQAPLRAQMLLRRPLIAPPDDQVPDLGHILHCEAYALAAEARILDAAIGHVVDAIARHVVDDDATDLEPVPRVEHLEEIAGEDAGLKAELAVVDDVERRVEIAEADQEGDRPERLLAVQLRRRIDLLEQCRLQHRAVALAAAEQGGALLDRILDPVVEPLRFLDV